MIGKIKDYTSIVFVLDGKKFFKRYRARNVPVTFWLTRATWVCHFIELSICKPRSFTSELKGTTVLLKRTGGKVVPSNLLGLRELPMMIACHLLGLTATPNLSDQVFIAISRAITYLCWQFIVMITWLSVHQLTVKWVVSYSLWPVTIKYDVIGGHRRWWSP